MTCYKKRENKHEDIRFSIRLGYRLFITQSEIRIKISLKCLSYNIIFLICNCCQSALNMLQK